MTLPEANAISKFFTAVPPPAVQLKRISMALGLPDTQPVQTSAPTTEDDALRQALAAGLPVMEGRPDDPMLDLLDL